MQHPILDNIAEFAVAEDPLVDLAVLVHAVQEFGLEGFHETVFEVVVEQLALMVWIQFDATKIDGRELVTRMALDNLK